ncbi:MAG: hypothetical protein PHY15_05000 [Eubacteriales bacterium]|nr:hypothetical protein [Eubacteriales bacterium]MDD4475445.1 hypothetical protein [Eubacteriales bacterium]
MEKLKRWFDNFWEYHKWKVFVVAIALAILSVTIPTILNRKAPDFSILYVGPIKISSDTITDINKSTSDYLRLDYNDDGEMNAELVTMLLPTALGPKFDESGNLIDDESINYIAYGDEFYTQFISEVMVGNTVIYIVNPIFYEKLVDDNYLVPLKDIFGITPESALPDGFGIPYANLDASNLSGFSALKHEMVICVRYKRPNEDIDFYNQNIELFKDFVKFKVD